jgi:hypothetical protein
MLNGESEYMHKFNTFAPNGYNKFDPAKNPGFHMGGCTHKEESKQKARESMIGKNVGKIQSEETIQKRALANTGKKRTQETKDKITKSLTGQKRSPEACKNISESHIGQIAWNKGLHTRTGENNGMYGKSVYQLWIEKYGIEEANVRKEQQRLKLSNSLKGKNKKKQSVS